MKKKRKAFYCNNKWVMAAFYSLCTEIKPLYLALGLAVVSFYLNKSPKSYLPFVELLQRSSGIPQLKE